MTIYIYVHIIIYIYINCHPQADCFVVSQLFSVAKHVRRLKRNPPNFTLDLVSDRSPNKCTTSAWNYKVLNSSSSVRLFTFYTLPDTRVLNSFEELCIIYIYIYIYIYSQIHVLYDLLILKISDKLKQCHQKL